MQLYSSASVCLGQFLSAPEFAEKTGFFTICACRARACGSSRYGRRAVDRNRCDGSMTVATGRTGLLAGAADGAGTAPLVIAGGRSARILARIPARTSV